MIEMFAKLKIKLNEYLRVIRITKKPDMEEFKTIIKVSALGMAVIGLLGFTIQVIATYFKG